MNYQVKYEIEVSGQVKEDSMWVKAASPEHAIEHAQDTLDQQHEDAQLLSCEVVATRED